MARLTASPRRLLLPLSLLLLAAGLWLGSIMLSQRESMASASAANPSQVIEAHKKHGHAPQSPSISEPKSPTPSEVELIAQLESAGRDLRAGRPFALRDRGQIRRYRLALNQVYEPQKPVHDRLRQIPSYANAQELLQWAHQVATTSEQWPGLVIYPEDGPATPARMRVLTGQILLKSSDLNHAEAVAATYGLKITNRPAYAPQHLVLAAASPLAAVDAIASLGQDTHLLTVQPLLMRQPAPSTVPDDPYYQDEWHLKNTGQTKGTIGLDIGVESVWDQYQGTGVRIAIVDDGLQLTHPDLSPNVDIGNHFDWNDNDTDPSPDTAHDVHGTAVGGLAGARGNNNLGVSGVAPQSTLVGFRLIAGLVTDETEAESATRGADLIQIKNNSWGNPEIPFELGYTGELMTEAMKTATTAGRGGLGTVFVWAAGNGRPQGGQSNKDGYSNSIYAVTVGAVSHKGALVSYSETGSNINVVAPSLEGKVGIATTDLVGIAGYNSGSTSDFSEVDYTNQFGGTSASAPIVSGVVALMLEANPDLNWRDVKEILLRSSTKLSPKDKDWVEHPNRDTWEAPFPAIKHHHSFGGGLVNAAAAVSLAEQWPSLGEMVSIQQTEAAVSGSSAPADRSASRAIQPMAGTPIYLPEETKPSTKTKVSRLNVDFSENTALRVENVTVTVDATHSRKGDLTLKLISPSGTVSVLASATSRDTGANYSNWTFSSIRHWGESSRGVWAVVTTEKDDDVNGTLNAVTIRLHGTAYPDVQLASAPSDVLVAEDAAASFNTVISTHGRTEHQWLKNGKIIPGATTGALTFNTVKLTDGGTYTYTAKNLTGTIEASAALGVVRRAVPSQHILLGHTATFTVMTSGPDLRYQWFIGSSPLRDDDRISGSRTAKLTIRKVESSDAQDYYCRVSLKDLSPINSAFATLSIMVPPTLDSLESPGDGIVSGLIEYAIEAENGATAYRASGLPPGLKLNTKTGIITGRPTKPGSYTVTFIASNAAGSSSAYTFTWVVEDLPPGTVGTYRGLVDRNGIYNGGYGGSFTLTIGKTGSFSGTVTRGKTRSSFKGMLDTYAGEIFSTGTISLRDPAFDAPLNLTFGLSDDQLDGSLGLEEDEHFASISAAKQWTGLPENFEDAPGLFNVPLLTSQISDDYPLGSGFISTTLTTKGRVSYSGRLADGTSITGSAIPCGEGFLPIHHMLYKNLGSLQGTLTFDSTLPSVDADMDWFKSPQLGSRSYSSGFLVHDLTGTGSRYTPPISPALVLSLPLVSFNAALTFSDGGLFTGFTQYFSLRSKNVADFSGISNPHQLALKVNAKTGMITGSGKAMDIDPENPGLLRQRPGTAVGLIIPNLNRAEGYFLLPENPAKNAPILSGRMIFQEAD
ncbi:Immunoglobulin I-set domain-containing protein [Prosthecobacter debontii]|uniref:Immunoglobulin I-set domain-containing protein n=2 Tax=Prosthecobacter debontii TaxID=48467 RepID=A0A1T4Y8M6_9BACT|nr:Immunoglobulin I-set domain-containing protein [Prosthecobacter debontii]